MANTYELIASSTIGAGGAAYIEFTSISGSYTDLLLDLSIRTTGAGTEENLFATFNSNTSGYSNKFLYGDGSGGGSGSATSATKVFVGNANSGGNTASTFSSHFVYIPNYTSSNYKSTSTDAVQESNTPYVYAMLDAGLWSNTAAITSIKIFGSTNNLAQYSTAYLYGIKNS